MEQSQEADRDGESVITYRTVEYIVAAVVLAVSILFLYGSYIVGIGWGIVGPQSGWYPFYVTLIIALCSIATIIKTLRTPRGGKLEQTFIERGQLKRVLLVLVPAALFVLGMELIGIYYAGTIYIALFMRYIGKYPWWRAWLLAIVINIIFFIMFEIWFAVPLYRGIYHFYGWTGY